MSAVWLLAGCESLGYYAQAVNGHARLMHDTRQIQALQSDPDTPAQLRQRLQLVVDIRDFASRELALPDNGSYRAYTDLQREAVVWSLVATPEFSVRPIQWCYPVIGCAAYRGYFHQDDAQAAGRELQSQGRDWTVEPVAAYSTLGWFDDPLPSTVLHWPQARLAGLMFHELAHQQLYLADDSAFNESFASAVQSAGVQRWLEQRGDAGALVAWRRQEQRHRDFVDLLLSTRERLQSLYRQPLAVEELRQRKRLELDGLHSRYRQLAAGRGEAAGFEAWFERPVNNARLALVGTYEQWRPAFLELLCRQGGDFSAFYRAAGELAKLAPEQRHRRLNDLSESGNQDCLRSCP